MGFPLVRYGFIGGVSATDGPVVVMLDGELSGDVVNLSEVQARHRHHRRTVPARHRPDRRSGTCVAASSRCGMQKPRVPGSTSMRYTRSAMASATRRARGASPTCALAAFSTCCARCNCPTNPRWCESAPSPSLQGQREPAARRLVPTTARHRKHRHREQRGVLAAQQPARQVRVQRCRAWA